MVAVAPSVLRHIEAGKLRALATPAPKRLAVLPDVPSLAELGHDVNVRDWHGIVLPAGVSRTALERLSAAVHAVLEREDVRARLGAVALEPAEYGPHEFRIHIASELDRWARLVRATGIRAD
jgi:tripartite-type tricarboxylate transporter receptor subunit TctC